MDDNVSDLNQTTSVATNLTTNADERFDDIKEEFSMHMLFQNADDVVKGVIIILVFFSVISWAIFIAKIWQFRSYNRKLKRDLEMIKNTKFLNELGEFKKSSFASAIAIEIKDEISKSKFDSKTLPDTQNRIRTRIETKISAIVNESRNFNSILASVGSSAPFIGLFGTVWGIMNSFIGIANSSDTGLDVVAPGIAEALFATAFGLAAAIPAVLFYNYVLRKTTKFANLLDHLATRLFLIGDRTLNSPKNLDDLYKDQSDDSK